MINVNRKLYNPSTKQRKTPDAPTPNSVSQWAYSATCRVPSWDNVSTLQWSKHSVHILLIQLISNRNLKLFWYM